MIKINDYSTELTEQDIGQDAHRTQVGGMWKEMGELQLKFMIDAGMRTHHKLVDVGCGALRGGIKFIEYLQCGNYFGFDSNESLVKAGKLEIRKARLEEKAARLLVNEAFALTDFRESFDYGLAFSLFTHLPINHIIHCLCEVRRVLKPEGVFFATYFEAPTSAHIAPINQFKESIWTRFDADPYHYSVEELQWMAQQAGLRAINVGDINHPRNQKMMKFIL